jgi:hypothetical protein
MNWVMMPIGNRRMVADYCLLVLVCWHLFLFWRLGFLLFCCLGTCMVCRAVNECGDDENRWTVNNRMVADYDQLILACLRLV